MTLWNDESCQAWAEALSSYPAGVARQPAALLHRLDPWYREELPKLIAARAEPHVTRAEVVRVVEWKMARGVWRARNLHLVRSNDEMSVVHASLEAFRAVPDDRRALKLLGQLRGVGPATVSALLAAYSPERYPFFDDLVAAQIPGMAAGAFTVRAYLDYAEALRARSAQLNASCLSRHWTPQGVGLALWAAVGGKADSESMGCHPGNGC